MERENLKFERQNNKTIIKIKRFLCALFTLRVQRNPMANADSLKMNNLTHFTDRPSGKLKRQADKTLRQDSKPKN